MFFYGKFISKNKLKALSILIISVPIFLASTFNSYGNLTFKKAGMDGVSQPENLVQAVPDAFSVILNEKNTSDILLHSLYMKEDFIHKNKWLIGDSKFGKMLVEIYFGMQIIIKIR